MSVQTELLKVLEENRNCDLSGQELADRFGVSRNAVWKAVKELRAAGYLITATTNRGYRLEAENDMISEAGIRVLLPENRKSLPIYTYDLLDSTNDEAKRRLANGEKRNILIVAEEQSNGHGRRGRNFYSPSHTGIYMSLLVHIDGKFEDVVSITTATSVIVANAITQLTGKEVQIKWVNDIYMDGKKVCGILTEAIMSCEAGEAPGIIVGIGINVSTECYPNDITDVATSLGKTQGVTRNQFIANISDGILKYATNVKDTSYMEDYRRLSMVIGKEITYFEREEAHSATVTGIDDKGGLMICTPEGEALVLRSGEITVRLKIS